MDDGVSEELRELRSLYCPPVEINCIEQCRRAWVGAHEGLFKDDAERMCEYLGISMPKYAKMKRAWEILEEHRGEKVYELIRLYLERSTYETNMAYHLLVTLDEGQKWEFLHANVPNLQEILDQWEEEERTYVYIDGECYEHGGGIPVNNSEEVL